MNEENVTILLQKFSKNFYLKGENDIESNQFVYKLIYFDETTKQDIALSSIARSEVQENYPHVFEWARDKLIELSSGQIPPLTNRSLNFLNNVEKEQIFIAILNVNLLLEDESNKSAGLVVPTRVIEC